MLDYSRLREKLQKLGYEPIPIVPKDKKPAISNWTDEGYDPPKGYREHGTGIRCGKVVAVDIDCLDSELSEAMQCAVEDICGPTICRVGKAPKTLLVYRAADAAPRKSMSNLYLDANGEAARVEILGDGQQFVAYGIHPNTHKEYEWPSLVGGVEDTPFHELPTINAEQIEKILALFNNCAEAKGYRLKKRKENVVVDSDDPFQNLPLGLDMSRAKNIVEKLDPDSSRDEWLSVGMALHHEYNGAPEAFEVWDEWSRKGTKYKEGDTERSWEGFGKRDDKLVTAATLLKYEKDIELETAAQTVQKEINPDDIFAGLPGSVERFSDDPPEIPMVINGFLPQGITGLFYSAGGVGKSTLLLKMVMHIAVANVHDNFFFNHAVVGGDVVIVTAEDPEIILNRRFVFMLRALSTELGIDYDELRPILNKHLKIVSTFGTQVHLFGLNTKGELKPTKHFVSLTKALAEVPNMTMLVIDTKTRFSPAEGEGNVIATQEITYYERIARDSGASVILLHHSTKASRDGSQTGAQAYRDASALYDSVRIAWYLRGINDKEMALLNVSVEDRRHYLYLENSKNNYLECNEPLVLKRNGYEYSTLKMLPAISADERKEAKYDGTYNAILAVLRSAPKGLSMAEMQIECKRVSPSASRRLIQEITERMLEDGLVEYLFEGPRKKYLLTDEGKKFDLTVE